MPAPHPFRPALFRFLRDLAANNDRAWFHANKGRFEDDLRGPALEFIAACALPLEKLSPHFVADPRPVGGSLFRMHRDVRFGKDKRPYKTAAGIHFRHEQAKDVHAPGFYLHLEPKNLFARVRIRRPDTATARAIRSAIVADPAAWKRATRSKAFSGSLQLDGEQLKRPPAGFDPEHPLVDDLRFKDFVAVAHPKQSDVTRADFDRSFLALCRTGMPMMRFLCKALELPC